MSAQPPVDPNQNPYGVTMYPVTTPSGGQLNLLTAEEADWYMERRDQYVDQNAFTNQSDLSDLDRVMAMECLIQRWSTWLMQGFDYMMTRVDEKQIQAQIAEHSKEVRQVKKSLGLDKASRDRDKDESVGDYITSLLQRAKEFGIHRDSQYEKAVTLMYQLKTMVGTFDRCDDEERKDLDLSEESILQWIRDNVIEEWDDIDNSFRENQKMWIRDLA